MWRAAAASMAYMNEVGSLSQGPDFILTPTQAADKISLKFSKKLTGKSEEPPRWRKCVGAASGLNFLPYKTLNHYQCQQFYIVYAMFSSLLY